MGLDRERFADAEDFEEEGEVGAVDVCDGGAD